MRIAFSGSHCVGKTSLLEAVARALPQYESVDEPYHQLEEEGYEHAHPPALEDYEAQLERAVESLDDGGADVLFDRCPIDVLAYLLTHPDAAEVESDPWIDAARDAMDALDLVVFLPIEEPDRIPVPAHEDRGLRQRVHDELERSLLDDVFELGAEVLVVEGDLQARLEQVLQRIDATERDGPR